MYDFLIVRLYSEFVFEYTTVSVRERCYIPATYIIYFHRIK